MRVDDSGVEGRIEIRLCCGCFLSKPQCSCRSRAKVFHHRKGCLAVNVRTYLLLGPRQLAFELLLVLEQGLILPAQSCKAFGKLLSELDHVALRHLGHVDVTRETQRQFTGAGTRRGDQL